MPWIKSAQMRLAHMSKRKENTNRVGENDKEELDGRTAAIRNWELKV